MRIQKILPAVFLLTISLTVVQSAFCSNIGRNVYGILTETYNGAKYGVAATDDDAIALNIWNGCFAITDRTDSPVPEGSSYKRITVNTTTGWDGWAWDGIGFPPTNTSAYKNMSSYYNGYLKFYARTGNAAVTGYDCGIKVGSTEVWLNLGTYGLVADGSWHEISIPLNTTTNASLTSANLADVTQMLMLRNGSATLTVGHVLDIDNIVWVKNSVGAFTPSLKRISDNVTTTTITWNNSSAMGSNDGWTAADQYVELDLDMYVTDKTWTVTIYTDNGAADKNGLISTSGNKIPLSWRASDYAIPYAVGGDTRTLTIGEVMVTTTTANLYDAGVVANPEDADYWCWFWIVDKAENYSGDYNIIWNNSGFHGASNTGAFYGMNQTLGIYPKIYMGGRFIDVIGGQYSATITLEFAYE